MVTGIPSLCLWLPETLLQDMLILPRVVHRKEEQVFLVQNVVGEYMSLADFSYCSLRVVIE